jgi:cytoskeletal protein CcmA (bactofilin family)
VLIVGEGGRWQGNIEADNVIVSGEVQGDIVVHNKLELTPTARVTGRISSPAIAVAEGAIHHGEVHMAKQADIVRFTEKRGGPAT